MSEPLPAPAPGMRGVRMGTGCAVHRHRELVPLNVHHIHPLGLGGRDVPANRVTLCANAHYSVHALLDLMLDAAGPVPWPVRRRYAWRVRQIAAAGHAATVAGR